MHAYGANLTGSYLDRLSYMVCPIFIATQWYLSDLRTAPIWAIAKM
jgi:hypothetical protein